MREGFRPGIRPEGNTHPTTEARPARIRVIERLKPEDIIVELVPPHELMPFILPPSAEGVVQAIAAFATSGETRTAVCEFEDRKNDTLTRITLENPTGDPFSMRITLSSPDREEGEKIPPGIGLKVVDKFGASQKELDKKVRLWRRRSPREPEPIIKLGDIVPPDGLLMMATRGKSIKRRLKLPKDRFPKGGKVTAIYVDPEDNNEVLKKKGLMVNGEFVFAIVDPIK